MKYISTFSLCFKLYDFQESVFNTNMLYMEKPKKTECSIGPGSNIMLRTLLHVCC